MKRVGSSIVGTLGMLILASSAVGSGGVIKRKTDGSPEGYYYNALGVAAARYAGYYSAGEFDPDAIICGVAYLEADYWPFPPGNGDVLLPDLRFTDANCPRYADLTTAGLIANADGNTLGTCSTTGVARTATFGGGAGTPDPGTAFLITLLQPANNDPNEGLDFCGIRLDTSSAFVNSARTQSVTPGGAKTTIGFNHFVEAIVFEPMEFDLTIRMTGSSRFPGDRSLPVMFARRVCDDSLSGCVSDPTDTGIVITTDDFITARLTVDNNTAAPRALNLTLSADRSVINPKLSPRDVTGFFRHIGGGPTLMNPISFLTGRSTFRLEVGIAIKRRLMGAFPVDLPFVVSLVDPNDPNDIQDVESRNLGLRPNAGYYDNDSHSGGFFFSRSPVVTGDAINVRFDSIDLPALGVTTRVAGVEFVGGEFGSSSLTGLDGFQLRREDPVLAENPDLSPQGLFRQVGKLGDPLNADGVPVGLPATTVLLDLTDYVNTPTDPALAPNLFGMAFLNPGDTLAALTAIGSSASPEVFVGNSSFLTAFRNPVTPYDQNDMEIRLDLDGELGSSLGGGRRTRPIQGAVPRAAGHERVVTREMKRGRR